jgi:hypothetical protein
MRYEIRGLKLGGVLDEAIKLTKNHFGAFFGVMAVTILPLGLVNAGVQLALLPAMPPNPTMEDLLAIQAAQLENAPILIGLLALLVLPIANAAQIHIVANTYLGKPASVGSAIGSAFSSLIPLYWTWFLLFAAVMGGTILCLIPGIIAAFWFTLATQVVVIEKISGIDALKRSREIMRGNIGDVFVLGLVIGIIAFGIQIGTQFIPQIHAAAFSGAVLGCVINIFSAAAMVVFYFSCRCKNEHFDLELLAQNVGIKDEVLSDDDNPFQADAE